jgi:protocatechuate 3,4-dioxygenase, beta subunit
MKISITLLAILLLHACNTRNQVRREGPAVTEKKVGGSCEGCEAIYECAVPFEALSDTDTLPGFDTATAQLLVTGTVYLPDNKTPAPGVVIYIYHTNGKGLYTPGPHAQGWEKRHGALRGWAKTNAQGRYYFYTQMPASYPNSKNPKHIHPVIKEPGYSEYYIDEFLFDDDVLLTTAERNQLENRGGYGVMTTTNCNGLSVAERNIYLGRNIPGYPQR